MSNPHIIEVRGSWGGTDGWWRPGITGTLNQTGGTDEQASTSATYWDAADAAISCGLAAEFANADRADDWRIREVTP